MLKKLLTVVVLVLFAETLVAQYKSRAEIPEKYKWDMSILYKSKAEWDKEYNQLSRMADELKSYQGKLSENSETFYKALRLYSDLIKGYYKLSDYAARLYDEDLNNSANQQLVERSEALGTKISEATAYMSPEILKIPAERIHQFFDRQPKLAEFDFFVANIQRLKKHTLSDKEEKILASAGLIASGPSTIHSIFENAEKPFPKLKLSDGKEIELNSSAYVQYRTIPNRKDRARVFAAFFNNYKRFQNTLGAILAAKVKIDYFYAKNKKYKTVLEYALDKNNIPVTVYTNLIKQMDKNIPTLHRMLKLMKRLLGVDTLHYYDLYMPIVKKADMKFTVEQAQKIILKTLKPMGKEYLNAVERAFNERWIDYYPTPGKRSGAYSSGAAYDYHPYILMNWHGDYNSLTTLIHEMGHTMHSYFSNKYQPFIKSDYPIFVAEIASTCNESLLNDYLVRHAKSDKEKLFLLGSYLELLRTTIFRQTSFAEFEWEIHKRVENNQPLTGEIMSQIYWKIVTKYYGNSPDVCVVDPYIAYEWAYIPHFVDYTYYVYQYATSLIYATAFAQKIIHEGEPAVKKYYNILKGGSSDYPINLIRKAGIDPLSSEAFDLTMQRMNTVMDEIEEILNKKDKGAK